jgi:hypothetical protein
MAGAAQAVKARQPEEETRNVGLCTRPSILHRLQGDGHSTPRIANVNGENYRGGGRLGGGRVDGRSCRLLPARGGATL